MGIRFTKMHGLGNDFLVVDAVRQRIDIDSIKIAQLSRRDTGIGFDQCLLIEPSFQDGIDFFYRIFNADGQEVGQCGNGARCIARFARHYGLTEKDTITVATKTTQIQLTIHADESVTVNMGKPLLSPSLIPLSVEKQAPLYTLPLDNNHSLPIHALSIGNPHAVMVISDVTLVDVDKLGRSISQHPWFPLQTNVGFMQIITPNTIHLRVYERGCGETSACGSGAVAAVAIGRLYHQLAEIVTVHLPGGELWVEWPDMQGSIFLRGPASFVYEGHLL